MQLLLERFQWHPILPFPATLKRHHRDLDFSTSTSFSVTLSRTGQPRTSTRITFEQAHILLFQNTA